MLQNSLPPVGHSIWHELVKGNKVISFSFLAVKLVLTRLQQEYKKDTRAEKLSACSHELYSFFEGKKHLPLVMEDIKKINDLCTKA